MKLFLLAFATAAIVPFAGIAAISHAVVNPAEKMFNDPQFGPSRISTVEFCLKEASVRQHSDLLTDSQFETYSACMAEMT
jgi:hypothetical protein